MPGPTLHLRHVTPEPSWAARAEKGPCTSNMDPAGEKVQQQCCLQALGCALPTRRRIRLAERFKNATSGLSG